MSIYSISGNTLNSAFVTLGQEVDNAYDLLGNVVFSKQSPIDPEIENIVSYFREPTLSVAQELANQSSDWENIIFITDPHGSGNEQHSQAIALYLLHNTNCKMLVLGGDYSVSSWSKTQYDNYMKPFVDSDVISRIYAIMGNHETYGNGTAQAKQSIYNDFLADKSNIVGVPTENYYYFDDVVGKTRYMFINTSDTGSAYVMSDAQITWISQNVVLPDETWSLCVFGHVTLAKMANVTYSNESNGSSIISAINNCNGTIIGYFCGHQHIDYCEKIGAFQHTTFQCDKFENTNYYSGISVTNRVVGTVSEQAVTVISINKTLRQVLTRRIGACRTRTMDYSY